VTYISGLSHFHKLHNFPDNTQVFVVGKMIGLKRKRPSQPDVRVPISLDLLKRLITSLRFICTPTYEAALFSSAFNLAFFALLRSAIYENDLIQKYKSRLWTENDSCGIGKQYKKGCH
jgi:hypothetical protein